MQASRVAAVSVGARANLQPAAEKPKLARDKPGAEGSRFLCA
ncbi:hypothetical protein [Paenibacillus dendritiformis]|nr:hypothetical protein [Paenibacillus dendritiformis]